MEDGKSRSDRMPTCVYANAKNAVSMQMIMVIIHETSAFSGLQSTFRPPQSLVLRLRPLLSPQHLDHPLSVAGACWVLCCVNTVQLKYQNKLTGLLPVDHLLI